MLGSRIIKHSRYWWLIALVGAAVWGASCTRIERSPAGQPAVDRVWPEPPEPARIAFAKSIFRPADLGIKRSGFTRLGQWLTGSEKGNEPLVKPFGIALDENDNLCLTDTGANAVCFYDAARKKWSRWDRIGKLRFASPVGVAKRNGIFYVADSTLGSLVAFTDTGKLVFQVTNHLARPTGVTIAQGKLFVADSQRHCVVSFALNGEYLGEFGKRGIKPGEFNFPTHINADATGRLMVTDSMNSRVQVLDANGTCLLAFGQVGDSPGSFSRPKGVAGDSIGNYYVVDSMFDNVQIFNAAGRLLLAFGSAGSAAGEFWLPNGIAIDRKNQIYVADSYNRRIQVFNYVGPL
ncbi:MAG TPA: 6-bladed beta-propeller [Clostridia bacterium]|nr:6-bladed beta-propeller [Clostridia bacterium]